jgi:transcriptional regulator with XRE-family HTH domain
MGAGHPVLQGLAMTNQTFAERLKAVFEADKSLKPASLAVKAGLDNSAIRAIMSGKSQNPRLDTVIKICAALGTTVEAFMSSPQTPEERRIVNLVSQLPVDLRRQLIGYGEALLEQRDQPPEEPPQADQ